MTLKKIITLLFLLFFVYSNTELGQLFKISNLVQHYLEHTNHKQEQPQSFMAFIINHYKNSQKHTDADGHDKHENLPFKTQTLNLDTVVLTFEEILTIFTFKKPILISVNQSLPIYKEWYISNVLLSIWQPPKLA
ncbi:MULTISPECIES: hypothetical protein [Flavobacterium]|uniref:Uncharacterized protein n=1 Tax=Flavobacterium commune TaxID=1306519 RepID=A0A1D9PDF7_9FLAO|nr:MULTISPECIES: hypothetical protein [Flavobacterium]APA00538.1 hypothetical protein BIW12_14535 [Flavobacterium commune]